MSDQNSDVSADERPIFPYDILWLGYGNAKVTIRELEHHADEYETFEELADHPSFDIPKIARDDVKKVVRPFGLSNANSQSAWLICSYYVASKTSHLLELSPEASRKNLIIAANAARELADTLGRLPPSVMAGLYFIRPTIPDVLKPTGPDFDDLYIEASDFADVASEVAEDLRKRGGRPKNHVRDTLLRLLLELCDELGFSDLRISNGTKAQPEMHLTGKAGSFIINLVQLVEPSWAEAWVASKLKAVRLKLRRAAAAGAKTPPK